MGRVGIFHLWITKMAVNLKERTKNYMENAIEIDSKIKKGRWRAIDIQVCNEVLQGFDLLPLIWGTDIWINNVPVLKCLVAANILVWILLFVL